MWRSSEITLVEIVNISLVHDWIGKTIYKSSSQKCFTVSEILFYKVDFNLFIFLKYESNLFFRFRECMEISMIKHKDNKADASDEENWWGWGSDTDIHGENDFLLCMIYKKISMSDLDKNAQYLR